MSNVKIGDKVWCYDSRDWFVVHVIEFIEGFIQLNDDSGQKPFMCDPTAKRVLIQ